VHELSLSSAILDTALRHAKGRPVTSVEVTAGALRQVVPSSLDFYWGIVTRDTLCEGAALELKVIEARLRCPECDREWTLDEPIFRCPRCPDAEVSVVCGTEFCVESIDIKEEEPCTAQR
jgi:hydrogenase nickel incorporation protein HypA/HybF